MCEIETKISGFKVKVEQDGIIYEVRHYWNDNKGIIPIATGSTPEEAIEAAISYFCDHPEEHRLYHVLGERCFCTMVKRE